jgi:hypothetical protein
MIIGTPAKREEKTGRQRLLWLVPRIMMKREI